jgi:hypothetical protein
MLVGLLRLRLSAGGTLYLSHLLWKQVGHCRFLVVTLLSHCIRRFSGCHLARYCYPRRSPASGEPELALLSYTRCFFTHHHLTPQLLLFLNINGNLRFLSYLAMQRVDRTWLYYKYQNLSTWYVISCAIEGGRG